LSGGKAKGEDLFCAVWSRVWPVLSKSVLIFSDNVVGGGIWKGNGVLRAYEWSGYYWMSWASSIREEFKAFMNFHGVDVMHSPGIIK